MTYSGLTFHRKLYIKGTHADTLVFKENFKKKKEKTHQKASPEKR